ncbi:DUF3040 domain-containing protein [Glaciihabitans sp. UYNi722]|uniref:DUF3040 domain-containing protein n=1 Tax=Glaciihabitans sp. UYNi722 TaxID=3156344 RepID=UPI0033914896
MPLSEQEQRLLEEMERSLYHNDADFVATVGTHRGRPNVRTVVIGILIGVFGIAVIVTGVVLRLPILGIAGFVIMFVGVLMAISSPRRGAASPAPAEPAARQRASFMDRMNERWDKRQDGHDE